MRGRILNQDTKVLVLLNRSIESPMVKPRCSRLSHIQFVLQFGFISNLSLAYKVLFASQAYLLEDMMMTARVR